jgi:ABC-2 type transport system ATP-binding protein
MSVQPEIEISGVTKVYREGPFGKGVSALEGIGLTVEKGQIFALLGPNGAGKTTTMNLLLGLVRPTEGQIRVLGRTPGIDNTVVRARIGYLPEQLWLPGYFSVNGLVDFYAQLHDFKEDWRKRRIGCFLEETGLAAVKDRRVADLSSGQLRTLALTLALLHEPELLILDEPTVFLDPLAIHRFRTLLLEFSAQGKTVLLSSHILSEVEKLATHIAIINRGRILLKGATPQLLKGSSLDDFFLREISRDEGDG